MNNFKQKKSIFCYARAYAFTWIVNEDEATCKYIVICFNCLRWINKMGKTIIDL